MEAHPPRTSFDQGTDMNLALREDIGAELDDFLLLSLLGVHDEAQESARLILWRHLRYFPVFAEVVDYVIENNDESLKWRLHQTIFAEDIDFTQPHEALFLHTTTRILYSEHRLGKAWRRDFRTLISQHDHWDSPILCHLLEIKLTLAARYPIQTNDRFHTQVLALSLDFLGRQMLTDAARCFSIAAATQYFTNIATNPPLQQDLIDTYMQISQSVGRMKESRSGVDLDKFRIITVTTGIVYLESFERPFCHEDLVEDLVLKEIRDLLVSVFDTLSDPWPRGQHIELCDRLRAVLETSRRAANPTLEPRTETDVFVRSDFKHESTSSKPSPANLAQQSSRSKNTFRTVSSSGSENLSGIPGPSQLGGLSDSMKRFIGVVGLQDCYDFCTANPEIFQEDLRPLQGMAVYYLRQGRSDTAARIIERRLMLWDSARASEDNVEWMRKLTTSKSRQEQLKSRCRIVLEALGDALEASEASTANVASTEMIESRASASTLKPEGHQMPKAPRTRSGGFGTYASRNTRSSSQENEPTAGPAAQGRMRTREEKPRRRPSSIVDDEYKTFDDDDETFDEMKDQKSRETLKHQQDDQPKKILEIRRKDTRPPFSEFS